MKEKKYCTGCGKELDQNGVCECGENCRCGDECDCAEDSKCNENCHCKHNEEQ